jgi:ADP-ribose pyrophosphatase YjhB (NUDIX family)
MNLSMLSFSFGDKRFNYRIVGIALREGHVLLHKEDREEFWSLPGGRAEWFEPSPETLRREMIEELGAEVEVGPLLWVVENFYRQEGQTRHELALYYRIELTQDPRWADLSQPTRGIEAETPMTFRWFPLEALGDLPLFPAFLAGALREPMTGIRHIIHQDTEERRVKG